MSTLGPQRRTLSAADGALRATRLHPGRTAVAHAAARAAADRGDLSWELVRQLLRSPAAGVPVGLVAGVVATLLLWRFVLDHPSHTAASTLLIAAGIGVALAATVATIWYGMASTREDR